MSRNTVLRMPEVPGRPGAWTFHAPIPAEYSGPALTVACVRLGGHAHIDVDSGRASGPGPRPRTTRGYAGRLILRWPEWLLLRGLLDTVPWAHVVEVENPRQDQLDYHEFGGPDAVEPDVVAIARDVLETYLAGRDEFRGMCFAACDAAIVRLRETLA